MHKVLLPFDGSEASARAVRFVIGLGSLGQLFPGSVANKVVHLAAVPVTLVK